MDTPLPDCIDLGDVVLRVPTPDDAAALHRATTVDLEHLRPWLAWATPEGNTLEQRRTFIERSLAHGRHRGAATYLFVDRADGTVLGAVGLHPRVGPGAIEVGYWMASAATGRGLMTRGVGALVDRVLADPEIERVEIHTDEANVRSAAVPRRLGFTLARTMDAEVTAPAESGRMQVWVRTAPTAVTTDDDPTPA